MATTLLHPNEPAHYDAVSEASTDGDDNQPLDSCHSQTRKKNIVKNKMKSSLCRNFSEKGYCPYGFKCQFAHGVEELRCNVDENAYKTKPCNAFWKKNCCPYGYRCNFSHSTSPNDTEPTDTPCYLGQYREIRYVGAGKGSRLLSLLS